jgi:type III secretion protein D
MKQLRILTGTHAGAQLALTAPTYRVGNGTEFDITIDDWNDVPIELVVGEGGNVSAYVMKQDTGEAARHLAARLDDFVPQRFLDVVLCCGPAAGSWPSDVTLLESLMRPAPSVTSEPRGARWSLLTTAGLCALALLAGFGSIAGRQSAAAQVEPQGGLVAQVTRTVEGLPFRGLSVTMQGERVVVDGMLASAAQVNTARAALARFPKSRLAHRYVAADETARSIVEALGGGGLTVAFRGNGVFVVQGQSQQTERLREASQRVAADLSAVVKRIDVEVTALPPPDRVPIGSVMATDGLQVVETRDGAKYLSLSPQPVIELVDLPAARSR